SAVGRLLRVVLSGIEIRVGCRELPAAVRCTAFGPGCLEPRLLLELPATVRALGSLESTWLWRLEPGGACRGLVRVRLIERTGARGEVRGLELVPVRRCELTGGISGVRGRELVRVRLRELSAPVRRGRAGIRLREPGVRGRELIRVRLN